jgi:hypothetical protein
MEKIILFICVFAFVAFWATIGSLQNIDLTSMLTFLALCAVGLVWASTDRPRKKMRR